MKRHERIAAVLVALGGVAVAWYGFAVLKLGSVFQPDAGFLPFLSGIVLVVLAVCWFFTSGDAAEKEKRFFEKGRWAKPAMAMGMMLVYAWAIEAIGYVTSTLVFMLAWQQAVERERWIKTILIALLSTLSMYVLFRHFLRVPLPPEIFVR
ncbi:MAG: tripartite tricarboxylate transporter TctB family protein [Desulfobacteraceae bacterium]|nr:MAG: tripartite tricarboxylate transporter TctB family protein [Desulfobacteraceae bacterium]